MFTNIAKFRFCAGRQAAFAETQRRDQGTVNEQIRIAPNGRREMGITFEGEAEMAEIAG